MALPMRAERHPNHHERERTDQSRHDSKGPEIGEIHRHPFVKSPQTSSSFIDFDYCYEERIRSRKLDFASCPKRAIPLYEAELAIVRKFRPSNRLTVKDIGRCYEGEINLIFHKKCLRVR